MDQIVESFGLDWKLFVPALINFLIVFGALYWILYKTVFSGLEERKEKIKEGIDKYEKSGEYLENAKKESSEIVKKANILSDDRIQKAKELAEEKKNQILAKAKEMSELERKKILVKAEEDKNKIISSAKNDIAEMAILQADKILLGK